MRRAAAGVVALLAIVAGVTVFRLGDSEEPRPAREQPGSHPNAARPESPTLLSHSLPAPPSIASEIETQTPDPPNLGSAEIVPLLDELAELGSRDDDPSLRKIMMLVRNHASREVRFAAIEAAEQFGSREASPALRELAAEVKDAAEKARLLEAAEFLEMPALSDFITEDGQLDLESEFAEEPDQEPGEAEAGSDAP